MRTLNIRGALIFAVLFLALAAVGSAYLPSDTGVHFSVESGFYDDPVLLEITCAVSGADIYYTIDGSTPTTRSYYYDEPLLLENVEEEYHTLSDYTGISHEDYVPELSMLKANVIRAAAFRGEERISDVHSASYFIGIDREGEYGDVPVISLIMEEDDLFDYETGIYTQGITYDDWMEEHGEENYGWWEPEGNFSNTGRAWERPVHVEYLPADGSDGFAQEMGVRIKGGASRIYSHKSLRFIARDEYGADRVKYPLFGFNERADKRGLVEEYKQFTLRSGGTDCNYTKIRDPLVQNLAQDLCLDTQRTAPCVVFINGEYWGLYSLTEEYGDHYIESNYDIERENTIIVKRFALEAGQESDYDLFEEMLAFIQQSDMNVEENYAKASSMLDMDNVADYFALQFYIDNVDGIPRNNNNWQMWRARTLDSSNVYGDGRWRFLLFDMDGAAHLGNSLKYQDDCLTPVLFGSENSTRFASLLRSLYQNDDFRRELILSMCDVRNIHFSLERFEAEMSALRSVYEPLMPDSLYRFGPQSIVDSGTEQYCKEHLDQLEFFFEGRYEIFPYIVQQALGLQEPVTANVRASGDGSVMVNHSVPDMQEGYTGMYFPDYPITLTAMKTGAGRFVRWEAEGCTLSDPQSPTTEVSFTGDFSVQAIFE